MPEKETLEELVHREASEIVDNHHIKTFEDTGEIHVYDKESGLYIPGEKKFITAIEFKLGEKATRRVIEEVLAKIRRMTYVKRESVVEPNLVPVRNGIFQIEEQKLIPYSHEYFFTTKHPVGFPILEIDRGVCPEKISKFMYSIMEGDLDKIETLEKMMAYCFYRKYPIQKAFMLLGAGSNGKSTLLNLLTQMLGKENVSNVELQSFENNRFATADLYNKNANIFADISNNALKNNSTFKSMCGDVDTLRSERKFQNSFGFNNYAKLIFSANQLPETHEESDAFFRRWCIIEFNKQFTGTEVNPNLTKEITEQEEMDKFFSYLMPKLRDILSGYFITEETIEEAREKYMRNANSTTFFASDYLEMDFEASAGKQEIWAAYLTFCKEKRLQVRTEKSFWSTIYRHFGDKIYERQVTNPLTRERQRTIYGIKLISKDEKESKDFQQNMRARDLGKKIIEYLLAYNGPEAPRFPITYFHDGIWEDQIQIRKIFWELKKAGVINEPVHGLFEVDKARAGL